LKIFGYQNNLSDIKVARERRIMAEEAARLKKQPKSFEALTPELSSWILDFTRSMNFTRTTPVQGMAIPLLMGNKDLVVEVRQLPKT
jgi:superfamily II DNA/RNA helicase